MTEAQDMLNRYTEAEKTLLEGKSYQWGERRLSFEDLSEIRAGRREWQARVDAEDSKSNPASAARVGGVAYARLS